MANFVATQFPNYHFVLESTGEQRMDFLNRLASLYNDMKSKGYPVLGATIVGEDETAHIELETKNGDTLTGLIDKGAIDSSRAKDVFGRILQTVREINQKEGKNTIFNQHYSNVLYDDSEDRFYFTNLVHNTEAFRTQTELKISPEYEEELRIRREEEDERRRR